MRGRKFGEAAAIGPHAKEGVAGRESDWKLEGHGKWSKNTRHMETCKAEGAKGKGGKGLSGKAEYTAGGTAESTTTEEAHSGQKKEGSVEDTIGKRRGKEDEGGRAEQHASTPRQDEPKEGEKEGRGTARRAPATLAMDDPDGEDAFAILGDALEQGPWDTWVACSDGVGSGMERGLTDSKVTVGEGFETRVQLCGCAREQETEHKANKGLWGEPIGEMVGELDIEQIGYKEWETSMHAIGNRRDGAQPRKHAWDQGDFEQKGSKIQRKKRCLQEGGRQRVRKS